MRTTAKRSTVIQAIHAVNDKYGYEIQLNRDEDKGKWFHFTLRSARSGVPGSRVSWSGKKLVSASWHAHGYVFEHILKLEPEARIISALGEINKDGGNWKDTNIGSQIRPVMFSETSIH